MPGGPAMRIGWLDMVARETGCAADGLRDAANKYAVVIPKKSFRFPSQHRAKLNLVQFKIERELEAEANMASAPNKHVFLSLLHDHTSRFWKERP